VSPHSDPLTPVQANHPLAITHLITESSSLFQTELKKKQESVDTLHSSLRTTSAQVGEARRTLEALQEKLKAQQLARQKVFNLKRACQEEEYQLLQLEQRHGRLDVASANAWEMELEMVLDEITASAGAQQQQQQQQQQTENGFYPGATAEEHVSRLPSAAVLRARVTALRNRSVQTQRAVEALRARSKDKELKYRRLVALCTRRPETEVDTLLDTLTRAVESEKGELEMARVRRFLGGVEGVA
jgi:regulatory protein SWI6